MIKYPRLSALIGASFCFLLASTPVASAQIPSGYYNSVNTSNQTTLRTTLNAVIDDHKIFPYTSGSTDTWDILKRADEDPTNSSRILDVYKNEDYQKASGGNNSYNREHTWPNSYGFPDDNGHNYPYTDCHQLFLSDINYNGERGSKLFGLVGGGGDEFSTVPNHGVGGGSGTYPGFSNWSSSARFEVWSDRRGDIARAMLYLDVRYEGGNHGKTGWSEPNLILTDNASLVSNSATGNNISVAYMGMRSVLLQWHAQDPVDAKERNRNDEVYSYQGNRNPFIDHPEWVDCLFNGSCGVDTVAPAAPAGLSLTVNGGNMNLNWAANTETDLAGYRVWRSTTLGGPYGELTSSALTATAFSDTTGTIGTTYYYVATAEDISGNVSTYSIELSGVPATGATSGGVWINELHYDNGGSDVGEFVEVAGPAGLDLSGYQLVGYNGNGGGVYSTVNLSGILPNDSGCLGALAFDMPGLQNGAPDGVALVGPVGGLIEFLSYEGSMVATNGPANGTGSIDIGVMEDSSVTAGMSLQRGGIGGAGLSFAWQAAMAETRGAVNTGQTFAGCPIACNVTQYGVGSSPANLLDLSGIGGSSNLQMTVVNLPNPLLGAYFAASAGAAVLPFLDGVALIDLNAIVLDPFYVPTAFPGIVTLNVTVPPTPSLVGFDVYFQAFTADVNQPNGMAFSNGLRVSICN